MGEVKVESHNMGPTFSRLTCLSFHVNRGSHSWVTTFSKFDPENQGSMSWVRSQFKVTMCVLHPIDSHLFRSMSIGHPIPQLRLFHNLTLKIKGQGHGWGHNSKSQCVSNILSTHIHLVPCQLGIPFLSYDFIIIWPWKSRFKVMGEVTVQSQKCGSNILSTHIPFVPCQSVLPLLRYSIFQNLTLKIQGQGQMTMMLYNYRSRQFHRTLNGINPPSGFRDMAKSGLSAAWFDKFLARGQSHMG